MPCYKSGSCGVYENRSCSDCPASKPEYLARGKRAAAGIFYEDAITVTLTREEIQKIVEKYLFNKALEDNVKITEELVEEVVSTSSEITSKIMRKGK